MVDVAGIEASRRVLHWHANQGRARSLTITTVHGISPLKAVKAECSMEYLALLMDGAAIGPLLVKAIRTVQSARGVRVKD